MSQYLVEAVNVSKNFPGVKALDNVSFSLKAGEVLALLGENGAGKSTLMKILSGIYSNDEGIIRVGGKRVENLTPVKAQELGIAIIHQELNMCEHLTIAENIFLGRELFRRGVLDNRKMNQETVDVLRRLNLNIDPETLVGDLPVSRQQMVEIAKALSTKARVIIMDEPTSALTSNEINELFRIIKVLRDEGHGIVYISHRLEELQYIVDRVMILRDGAYVTSCEFNKITLPQIISHMIGREIHEKYPRISTNVGKTILEVKNLQAGHMVRDVSFKVREGEIVGIAGLMGAGRTETTRALFGADPKDGGQVYLDGLQVKIDQPADAIRKGIVLVPENRRKDGLCIKRSIRENLALPNLDRLCNRLGVVNQRKEKELTETAVKNLQIRLANVEGDAENLSGGNQQKVVVGKWLARNSRVMVFDEPTRGIDVAAKVEIYHLLNQLKQQKIGVLFVSSELTEILGISDRILVMCEGKITREMDREEATQDLILAYATQFENKMTSGTAI